MKRITLRATGVSALAAVALGIAVPAATAATTVSAKPVVKSDGDDAAKAAEAARKAAEAASKSAAEAVARATAAKDAEAARKAAEEASRNAAEAAKAPSVSVRKIFLGKGIVASVDVSFDYLCTSATDRLEVTLTSAPKSGKPTVFKSTRAQQSLQCDGAKHTGFVEWQGPGLDAFGTDNLAKATVALYGKGDVLQAPIAEKSMKPGYDTPSVGL
ncbi:hypothetical protein AB0F13_21070 [Streptomyces sp. NPDC026206]|uniref:hypothetical protein n=1 Tax=Streptomyces sp. NPDC026206 TaxID=3157089 RepID=UPI0033F9427B